MYWRSTATNNILRSCGVQHNEHNCHMGKIKASVMLTNIGVLSMIHLQQHRPVRGKPLHAAQPRGVSAIRLCAAQYCNMWLLAWLAPSLQRHHCCRCHFSLLMHALPPNSAAHHSQHRTLCVTASLPACPSAPPRPTKHGMMRCSPPAQSRRSCPCSAPAGQQAAPAQQPPEPCSSSTACSNNSSSGRITGLCMSADACAQFQRMHATKRSSHLPLAAAAPAEKQPWRLHLAQARHHPCSGIL
jgi:hypothetical protein